MQYSPFVSRTGLVLILSFISSIHAQLTPEGTFFKGGGAPGAAPYQLVDDYDPSIFFSKFNFYSSYDPTYGHVKYVTRDVAYQNGYVSTGATAKTTVDTTNKWPRGGDGRPSTRLESVNAYTHGLFILDLVHMPWGCGTWPAYWLVGPDWAKNGEIDIIEGVNTGLDNSISMHTEAGCTIAGSGQTATFQTSNCDHNLNGNSGCGSSLKHESIPNNYGDDLNRNGGGVYATEWTSEYVKHWFFPRGSTPANIASGNPDPATWGTPTVNAQGDCDIDSHFNNMSIIINTDFCGAWAGWVYQSQFPECPQNMNVSSLDSCVDFVGNNPSYFVDAYWEINSLRVFQMPEGSEASEPYSTSLSSVTPAASTAGTSGLPVGPGASTGDVSSAPYTGPTSSGTVSAPASTSTPIICPDYNGTVWTNSNSQQYSIACGSDYQGGGPSFGAQSFANCMEICDGTDGCRAVSFTGGNGAGVCYIKTERGSFNYDGVTNAAERESGTGSASSSIQAPIISSRPATSYGDVSSTLSRRDMSTSSTVRMSSPRDTSVTSSSMLAYESENMSTVGLSTAASPSPPALSMLTSRPAPESTRTSASQSQTSTSVAIMPSGAAGTSSTHSSSPVMDIELPTSSERPGYESAVRTSSRTRSTSSAGVSSSRSSSSSEAPGGYTSTMAGQQSSTSSVALPPSSSIIPVLPSSYVAPSNVMPPSSSMASSSPMAPSSSMVPSSSMAPPSSMVPSSYIAPSSRVALSSSVAPLSSMASSSSIASPSYISPSSYIGPPVSSSVRQSSSTLPGPIFYTSQRSISSTSTRTSGSTVPAIVSTTSSASFTPGPNSTPTFIAPPAEQLAPSCPADAEDLCNDSEESSICSSESGSNYGVTCGVAYQGVVLNPNVYRRKRQSYEPSLQQCTNLCDTTTGCVAFNYIGTDCTLFSSVTGTYYAPGAVGAAQVTPPTTATPVTPPVYTSPSSVGQAPQSDTTTGATSTQPIFSGSTTAMTSSSPTSSAVITSNTYTTSISTFDSASVSLPTFGSGSGSADGGSSRIYPATCKPTPGRGTTTVFTTSTVISCGQPLTCAPL